MNEQDLFEFKEPPARERSPHLIPWLVTGAIAIVLLVASIVILNMARGGTDTAEPSPSPTTQSPEPSPTTVPSTPPPTQEPEPEPAPEPENPDDVIDTSFVNVGDTFEMDIQHWSTRVDLSTKFGSVQYMIEGEKLVLNSSLIDSFPEACADMRSQWGIERVGANEFEVLSPQQMCTENESLYTEVLGLIRAMTESARPL